MQFGVLGPLSVVDGDRAVALGPPQQRSLLAALLVDADRVVDVGVLVDRLWGDEPTASSLTSLHASMSRLRKRLTTAGGRAPIVTQHPGYRLVVPREDVDALRFADRVAAARRLTAGGAVAEAREQVGAALALWRGAPYEDVRAEVLGNEVTRLRDQWLTATELAAELDLALGRSAELAERLPAVIAEHPLREGLAGTLMTALYRLGRQAEALDVFARTREVLADELGIDPSPELQRVHGAVLRQDPSLDPTPPPVAPRPRPAPPATPRTAAPAPEAMVGRDAELDRCMAAVRRAFSGVPTTTAVYGEAGIGKIRLAEEVAARAAALGADVAWGRVLDQGGSPAFWPWTQALTGLANARGPEALRRALGGRGAAAAVLLPPQLASAAPPVPDIAPEAARLRLFDAVTAVLEVLATEKPVCVVLEDLHWADGETGDLTEYVTSTARDAPLALLLTVRDPTEGETEQGRRLLGATSRRPGVDQVRLEGLDVPTVRQYAAARLGRDVDAEVAGRLHQRTNGNPFFIAELVRLLADERQVHGRAQVAVPTSVRAVIERRFQHLAPEVRTMLSAAAVIGRVFDARVLGDVLGTSALHLADGLDAATAAGVLVAEADHPGTCSFQHALVQEALLVGIGPMRRAALHAQVAEALERRHHGDLAEVAAVLAQHHVAAGAVGDAERTVALLLLAADGAQRQSAYREAERLLRQALETVSASPGTAALTAELEVRVRLGSLLTLTLGYNAPEVVVERRRALQLATEVGSVDHLLSALWGSWGVALVSGDLPAADGLAEEMGRAAARRAEPMLLLAHHQALGQVRYHQGQLADACAHLQRAVDLAGEHADRVRLEIFLQDPGSVCRAWLATVLALQGEVAASDAQAGEALAVAAALGHRYTEVYLRILEAWRAMFLLRTDDAVTAARAGLAVACDEGFDQLVAFCRQPLGWGLAHQGDPAAGIAELTRGREFFTALAAAHMFGHVMLGALAEAHELAGDDVAAAATAGRAIEESRRTGESFYLPAVHLLRARLAGRAGRPAEAVAELETGLAVARAQHAGLLERRLSAELDRLAGTAVGGRQADDKPG